MKLKEIAPLWAKAIRRNTLSDIARCDIVIDGKRLDMLEYDRCLVGEAHGFTNRYRYIGRKKECATCGGYADAFFNSSFRGSRERFTKNIRNFVRHFEKVHKKGR